MDYLFGFGAFSSVFAVPGDVVDVYLNEALPDDIKVLLYILRHQPENTGDEEMSRFLGLTKEKIQKSIDYWTTKKILLKNEALSSGKSEAEKKPAEKKVIEEKPSYSAEEIEYISNRNPELKFLLSEASQKLGRLLSSNDCSALVYLFSGVGMPADVILMLMEYCVSIGKGNVNYIMKMGVGWADEGVSTHELAESKIIDLEKKRSYEGKIKTAMGITGRALSSAEKTHIGRWSEEWSIPVELVAVAYEICVDRLGKISFAYINSILKSWHEKGIRTIDQVKSDKSRPRNPDIPNNEIDEYVRLSIKRLKDQ